VQPRITTVLEGESLLNDATALVLLRSATAAVATSVSLLHVAGEFVLSVLIAVAIGLVVGAVNLRVRARIAEPTINTAISFAVPFVAFLPAEHLHASGLVAAVTAGLITGHGAPHRLRPQDRISEALNWRTIELLLEGAVFLIMGLELYGLVQDVREEHGSVWTAFGLGLAAIGLVLVVRAAYVAVLLWALAHDRRRGERIKDYLHEAQSKLDDGSLTPREIGRRAKQDRRAARFIGGPGPRDHERFSTRIRRKVADIEYVSGTPLGPREGTVLVWAGMRGAITVAAAQSLESGTTQRSLLVLIAFVVATGSLLVQGGTLPWVVRRLGLADHDGSAAQEEETERHRLREELSRAAIEAVQRARDDAGPDTDPRVLERLQQESDRRPTTAEEFAEAGEAATQFRRLRIAVIRAQRDALLKARDEGSYSSSALEAALVVLDADEIRLELRENF
jgi:NhaP-type Na+/H+ or K+/H+ antiporter